jgi:hypothetical protein
MGLGSTRLVASTGAGSTRLRVVVMSTTSGKPGKISGRAGARPIVDSTRLRVALPKRHHVRELAKKKPRANRG